MTGEPVVSVVIPVFNRAHLVGTAIHSALSQTLSSLEVVVVDDGSTDSIAHLMKHFTGDDRLRLVQKPNGGVSSARNHGIDSSRGTFVAFLDSDDTWEPTKLERQLAAAKAHPRPDRVLVTTQSAILSDGYRMVLPQRPMRPGERAGEYLYAGDGFAQASSLFLSRAVAQAIRFHEGLAQFEDHLFFISVIEAGVHLVQIDAPLVTINDYARADRLSRRKSLAAARQFRAAAGDLLNAPGGAAFDAAEIAPELWRTDVLAAFGLQVRALRSGAIPASKFARTLVRTLLPSPVRRRLQARLYRARGAVGTCDVPAAAPAGSPTDTAAPQHGAARF